MDGWNIFRGEPLVSGGVHHPEGAFSNFTVRFFSQKKSAINGFAEVCTSGTGGLNHPILPSKTGYYLELNGCGIPKIGGILPPKLDGLFIRENPNEQMG